METLKIEELLKLFSLPQLIKQEQVIFIDVREPEEFKYEHIEGAVNIPLSQLTCTNWESYQGKTVIFHCRSGTRTQMNGSALAATPCMQKYCLSGGISAWQAANLPTQKMTKAPVDVMRQMQFIVSIMIFMGILLGWSVSPYFLILALFAGAGLMVSAVTGFCGMVYILKLLPWNK